MKKNICRLTAITLALLSFTVAARFVPVSAADGIILTVTPAAQSVRIGDEVLFTIGMSGAEGTDFFAFGFDILIPDGLVLKPGTGAVSAAFKAGTGFEDADFQETPRLNVSGGLNDAVYNGGPLEIASFVCTAAESGDKTVTLTNIELLDERVAYIPVNLVPANISVVATAGGNAGNTGGASIPATDAGATEATRPTDSIPDTSSGAPGAWTNPFIDIKESDWFFAAVKYATENRLMNGTAADTFSPNAAMTRAMLVTVLHRLENEPQAGAAAFTDVSATGYYAQAVAWASANGIVEGVGDGLFAPNAEITREQLAAMLYRYASAQGLNVSARGDISSFPDEGNVSPWAADAVSWAAGTGVITGRTTPSGAELAPKGTATRAEVAAMMMRIERTAEI
jgi:hypothetical protein